MPHCRVPSLPNFLIIDETTPLPKPCTLIVTMNSNQAANMETAHNDAPTSLAGWSNWLCEQEMPIFSHTAQRIHQAVVDEKVSTMELSTIILQDPTLTARILKLSNSSICNPARLKVDTISRALVILGYKAVSELALACTFIESIAAQNNRGRVDKEIGRALHAAVQAKSFAQLMNDPAPEEIFIAALLKNLGRIVFFCFDQNNSAVIDQKIAEEELSPGQAEKSVLGFSLDQLGASLSRTWKLSGLIDAAISGTAKDSARVHLVNISHQIATESELGWESDGLDACLDKVETLTYQPRSKIIELIRQNAEKAVKVASQFGAGNAAGHIPSKAPQLSEVQLADAQPTSYNNAELELQILQDITRLLVGEIKINAVFEMVMEGIHRGVGMDRSLFTLVSPDRTNLKEKSALGWPTGVHNHTIRIPIVGSTANLFSFCMQQTEGIWIRPDEENAMDALYTPQILAQFGRNECFLGRLFIESKTLGVFYSDRGLCNSELDQKSFDSFRNFVQQANLALALSQRR